MSHHLFQSKKIQLFLLGMIGLFLLAGCRGDGEQEIFLTEEERQWLEEKEGQISIGYTTDYPPVEFLLEGEFAGISADYFALLEKKLQIELEMVEFDEWTTLMEAARNREISGITAATKTPERSEYLNFTVPYIFNPNVIITRENFSEKLSFAKLENTSMDTLVVEEYSIIEYLKKNHSNLEYRTVATASDGLRKVSFGEADAMIIEVMSAAESIERDNITNLIVNTETPYESTLSIATRNDWPILNDIFNKGLAQINEAERREIRERWVPFDRRSIFENPYFWITLVSVFMLLIIAIIVIFLWNKTLQKAVTEKTLELEASKKKLMDQFAQLEVTEQKLLEEIEIRKESEAKIKYKSYHDDLTGLHNRAYYTEQIERLQKQNTMPLAIMMIDLNGLKITNDTLGHQEGDRLLVKAANIIKTCCRRQDMAARIGGDEFVLILPEATEKDTENIAKSIKRECKESGNEPMVVSLAIGWAVRKNDQKSLQTLFEEAEDHMYHNKMEESENEKTGILSSMEKRLRDHAVETLGHSQRIKALALKLGEALGLEQSDLNALARLAELHDIGMLGISKEVVKKSEALTDAEWEKIKRHPSLGYKIVSSTPALRQVAEGVLAHHEHWDGKGYPQGLRGEEIPLLARIIAITDAYDVMTQDQPYQKAKSQEEAIVELKNGSGTQFDPTLVNLLLSILKKEKTEQ
ncbi:HD domain-containing phosphohydrolase [Tindallia californiensis]|uniref:Diguanylate cyclase (GGDEF) domain-containing protein n=1 Tax=Tindallia californiensis TaxID=159292 RepID=A0A1H3LM18_9FIRM|nr:HD domain-containing phosphohydrolase [Tindallia californiensis]SDY65482.1 diguanylate cyclase (GGDEF) domain-containing protein [Tindallia californiensis]